jgi:hypothetical protein
LPRFILVKRYPTSCRTYLKKKNEKSANASKFILGGEESLLMGLGFVTG